MTHPSVSQGKANLGISVTTPCQGSALVMNHYMHYIIMIFFFFLSKNDFIILKKKKNIYIYTHTHTQSQKYYFHGKLKQNLVRKSCLKQLNNDFLLLF